MTQTPSHFAESDHAERRNCLAIPPLTHTPRPLHVGCSAFQTLSTLSLLCTSPFHAAAPPGSQHRLGPLGHHQQRPALPRQRQPRHGCVEEGGRCGQEGPGRRASNLNPDLRVSLPVTTTQIANTHPLLTHTSAQARTSPPPPTWTTSTPSCVRRSRTGSGGCRTRSGSRAGASTTAKGGSRQGGVLQYRLDAGSLALPRSCEAHTLPIARDCVSLALSCRTYVHWNVPYVSAFHAVRLPLPVVHRYGSQFIGEYVEASVGGDVFNVGELWTDMWVNGAGVVVTGAVAVMHVRGGVGGIKWHELG